MAKKSNFEKAAQQFGNYNKRDATLTKVARGNRVVFQDCGEHIVINGWPVADGDPEMIFPVTAYTTVGDICRFITHTLIRGTFDGEPPPPTLVGSTESGSFEDLITKEGERLAKQGILHLGRYPVASAMTKHSNFPVQMPSKPDFEGVTQAGRQFILEAKVCTQGKFRVYKVYIKQKQVRHMLERSDFNVPGCVLLHFNERQGATFYEDPFTVAIPVKRAEAGGWPIWEQFAALSKKDKDKELGAITRDLAKEIGIPVRWHIPPRCKAPRPDLEKLVERMCTHRAHE